MNWNWVFAGAVTTLIMGPWNFGLAGERPVFRAQNAGMYPASYSGYSNDVYYDEECDDDHCGPFCHLHNCWHYISTLGGKQGSGIGSGRAQRDPRDLSFQYMYRYQYPKDLRYPAPNQPAAVVVYPYYTVKGPDDFFLNDPPAPYWP